MKRRFKEEEKALIHWLVRDTDKGENIIENLDNYLVNEMDDGGMGSLRVVGKSDRSFGRELAQGDFHDVDGVPVFISVILDVNDDFYDLDVFKGDFSPLKKFPEVPKT
ncbi:DUF6984 family protein [Sphingobacterium sp. LRF_L2]|uniref:DUF6984 family protein n=1 Tax=Sphingobacterium sp. LRF_L2 TaxID=3369421 RepID=UPI003F5FDE0D